MTTYPRIVMRRSSYRGKPGYTVTQYRYKGDSDRFAPSVFVETRRAAVRCKMRFKFSEEITLADMMLI